MNNQFSSNYISLLRKQVQDEINYLVCNGHDHEKIYIPCMFCASHRNYYTCNRLKELRRFLSSINTHNNSTPRRIIPTERKRIGFAVNDYSDHNSHILRISNISEQMPLLSIDL